MKRKQGMYVALAAIGAGLAVTALILRNYSISNSLGGALMGVGAGLCTMGLAQLLTLRSEKKHPEQMKQNEIAMKDDRNVAIRRRAKALSGDFLQWVVMAAAWLSIGLDAPLWVSLLAIMIFVFKNIFELFLIVHYQKVM